MAELRLALLLAVIVACVIAATMPTRPRPAPRTRPRGERRRTEPRRDVLLRAAAGRRHAWDRSDLIRGVLSADLDSGEPIWPPRLADGWHDRPR